MEKFENATLVVNQEWLDNWKNTVDERLNNWMSQFDKGIQDKLDFSPESLKVAEQTLLGEYDEPYPLFIPENFFFLDGFNTYVGEVFRRNDKVRNLYWSHSKDVENYHMPILSTDEFSGGSVAPSTKFNFVINVRTGTKMFEFFEKNINYYIENEQLKRYEHLKRLEMEQTKLIDIDESKGIDYEHFILIKNNEFESRDFMRLLEKYCSLPARKAKLISSDNGLFKIKIRGEYTLHFDFNDADHVLEESQDLAERYEFRDWGNKTKEDVAKCATRIEFWGDEDENGDNINEYMFILSELVKHPDLLVYDINQGVFYDEI